MLASETLQCGARGAVRILDSAIDAIEIVQREHSNGTLRQTNTVVKIIVGVTKGADIVQTNCTVQSAWIAHLIERDTMAAFEYTETVLKRIASGACETA